MLWIDKIKVEIKLNDRKLKYGGNTGNVGFVEKQWEGHQLYVWFVDNGSIGNAETRLEQSKKHKQNLKHLFTEDVKEAYHHLVVIDLIFLVHNSYSS